MAVLDYFEGTDIRLMHQGKVDGFEVTIGDGAGREMPNAAPIVE